MATSFSASNLIANVKAEFSAVPLCSSRGRENVGIASSYFVFLLCGGVVAKEFSDHDFSAVLTFGSGVQTLGFLALLLKVRAQKTVKGISSRTLETYVGVFMCRLSSTLIKNGYLPLDRSGDWAYQLADIVSLVIVLQLLYSCHKTYGTTYQLEHDTLDLAKASIPCLMLAVCTHGDLCANKFFDVMWTLSMNLDTIALLPQLWMLTKIGGEVEGQTTHFVASIFVSKVCAMAFWTYGYEELAPKNGNANIPGWTIMIMHGLQLLLSADFMLHYLKSRFMGGKFVLPQNAIDV